MPSTKNFLVFMALFTLCLASPLNIFSKREKHLGAEPEVVWVTQTQTASPQAQPEAQRQPLAQPQVQPQPQLEQVAPSYQYQPAPAPTLYQQASAPAPTPNQYQYLPAPAPPVVNTPQRDYVMVTTKETVTATVPQWLQVTITTPIYFPGSAERVTVPVTQYVTTPGSVQFVTQLATVTQHENVVKKPAYIMVSKQGAKVKREPATAVVTPTMAPASTPSLDKSVETAYMNPHGRRQDNDVNPGSSGDLIFKERHKTKPGVEELVFWDIDIPPTPTPSQDKAVESASVNSHDRRQVRNANSRPFEELIIMKSQGSKSNPGVEEPVFMNSPIASDRYNALSTFRTEVRPAATSPSKTKDIVYATELSAADEAANRLLLEASKVNKDPTKANDKRWIHPYFGPTGTLIVDEFNSDHGDGCSHTKTDWERKNIYKFVFPYCHGNQKPEIEPYPYPTFIQTHDALRVEEDAEPGEWMYVDTWHEKIHD